jgi:hypothetical protein
MPGIRRRDLLMPPTIKNPAGEDGALGDAQ